MLAVFVIISIVSIPAAIGHCGLPGSPENGIVTLHFNGSTYIAKYECPGSFILDGCVERICHNNGLWTGIIPRCGMEIPIIALDAENITNPEKLTDRKYDTSEWIGTNTSLTLTLGERWDVNKVTLIKSIANRSLNEEVERVTYVDPGEVAARHKREEETPLDDEIYINWTRDKSGNFVRIKSNRGGSFISEIQIHAASYGCGEPDHPFAGVVKSVNATHKMFKCFSGYLLTGPSFTVCSKGRWSGEQRICRLRSSLNDSNIDATVDLFGFELGQWPLSVIKSASFQIKFTVVSCLSIIVCACVLLWLVSKLYLLWVVLRKTVSKYCSKKIGNSNGH